MPDHSFPPTPASPAPQCAGGFSAIADAPPAAQNTPAAGAKLGSVVLFSPSCHSLYTIGVAELLRRAGVDIAAIVVRRLLNPSRFTKEFARDGTRLLRKIWRKIFLRRFAYSGAAPYQTLPQFLDKLGVQARTVGDLQRLHKIPVVYCDDLGDALVVQTLRETKPRLVVFTGGGLIREEILKLSGDGVLNCHMGKLPDYRGMDVVEWPILENRPQSVGITVHFMDKGVDTGDILATRAIPPVAGEGREELRGRFEVPMCCELAATATRWLAGEISRQTQPPETSPSGLPRQYFKLHPRLQCLAESRLRTQRISLP